MAQSIFGFLYTRDTSGSPMQSAKVGDTVQVVTGEPPFVINFEVSSIIVTQWPGKLWFVEIESSELTSLLEDDNCAHATRLKVLKKLPSSLLFGARGEGVCQLLETINNLNLEHIEKLASIATPMAADAYAQAWNNWLTEHDNNSMHVGADHCGTLAIGTGEKSSPIYSGFLAVNHLVHQRAMQLQGEQAFITQTSYNETITYLSPLWNQACSVLLQAAMGLGAIHYVNPKDINLLLSGWELVNEHQYDQ